MASAENIIEQIEIALLGGQAALSGFSIVQFNDDDAADRDRIVVKCSPREIALPGTDPTKTSAWLFKCEIAIHLATRSASTFDTVIAAVEAAHATGASIPSAAATLASANFANGLTVDSTNEGDMDHGGDKRSRAKVFNWTAIA